MVVESEGESDWVEQMKEIEKSKLYFGVVIDKNGKCRKELKNCVAQGSKAEDVINRLAKQKDLSMGAVRGMCDRNQCQSYSMAVRH